ncbi:MAG TPA: hypothetical protein VGG39_01820 [Polyangiaceae bacterium]|jgi:hypothetical protein
MRAVDEPIPTDEQLYRSIAEQDVDGEALDPTALDVPGTSVARSKYQPVPTQAIHPGDGGIAVIVPRDLPSPMVSSGGARYEFVASDDPLEDNDSHAEIRMNRPGKPYKSNHKVASKEFELQLRAALALRFRILIDPRNPKPAA